MTAKLVVCASCGRHVRPSERPCPFCDVPSVAKATMTVLAAAAVGVTLSACYGGPRARYLPPPQTTDASVPSDEPHAPPPVSVEAPTAPDPKR